MRGAFTSGRTDRRDDASRFGAAGVVCRGGAESEQGERVARRKHRNEGTIIWMRIGTFVLVLGACGGTTPVMKASAVDEPMPALTLPLLAGGTWSSATGAPMVIDVWASWCKPCSKGFPKLDALAARRTDAVVVAITIDEDAAAARDFLAQFPLAIPVVHDAEQTLTKAPLAIARLPTVLVVDANGTIRHRLEEPTDGHYDRLEALIGHRAP